MALPAGAWFLTAQLVYFIEGIWSRVGLPGAFTSPADAISFAFTGAGVAVVLLYALSVGLSRVRGNALSTGQDTTETTSADD